MSSGSGSSKKRELIETQILQDEDPALYPPFKDQPPSRSMGAKKIRKINPLGMRVVVKILQDQNMTEAGLYLPEGAKQAMMESLRAKVIEVARSEDEHDDANVSGIPLGEYVLIPKTAGVRVPWDDSLRIVDTKDVLAVIREISIS